MASEPSNSNEYSPSEFVTEPAVVPFTKTLTPGNGSPVFASVTLPFMFVKKTAPAEKQRLSSMPSFFSKVWYASITKFIRLEEPRGGGGGGEPPATFSPPSSQTQLTPPHNHS